MTESGVGEIKRALIFEVGVEQIADIDNCDLNILIQCSRDSESRKISLA